jgi:hypothetical protein
MNANCTRIFTTTLSPFDIAAPPCSRIGLAGLGDAPTNFTLFVVSFPAHLLSLEGAWLDCKASYRGGSLVIDSANVVVGRMSGSPLISTGGAAIGVVSSGNMAAYLTNDLPNWPCLR